jgi:hypothetical protein
MKIIACAASAILAVGCAPSPVDPVGDWGGDHVALQVGASQSTIEFDCAHGKIPGPFAIGADGVFDLDGVFVREHGGPAKEGETLLEAPVRYSGVVAGKKMRLVVMGDGPIGDFALEKGAAPALTKCL